MNWKHFKHTFGLRIGSTHAILLCSGDTESVPAESPKSTSCTPLKYFSAAPPLHIIILKAYRIRICVARRRAKGKYTSGGKNERKGFTGPSNPRGISLVTRRKVFA